MKKIILLLSKLLIVLTKIHKDKLLHFFYATILAFVSVNINITWGSIFCVFMFALKETVWDGLLDKGEMSFGDFIYGLLPLVIIILTKIL